MVSLPALLLLGSHYNKPSTLSTTYCTFYVSGNQVSYIKMEENTGIIIPVFAFQHPQVSKEENFLLILKIEKWLYILSLMQAPLVGCPCI